MKPPLRFRRLIYLTGSLIVAGMGLLLLMVAMPHPPTTCRLIKMAMILSTENILQKSTVR